MKITLIIFLFAGVFAMPKFSMKTNSMKPVGIHRTGMTSTSIRTYFRQQRAAAITKRRRVDNILSRYFNLLDM